MDKRDVPYLTVRELALIWSLNDKQKSYLERWIADLSKKAEVGARIDEQSRTFCRGDGLVYVYKEPVKDFVDILDLSDDNYISRSDRIKELQAQSGGGSDVRQGE